MTTILGLTLLFGATAGHILLVGLWLRLFSPARRWDPAEFTFQTLTIGLGSLQAILHLLAFTVGLSLASGLFALAALHAAATLLVAARRRPALPLRQAASAGWTPAAHSQAERLPLISLAGIGIVAALVAQWLLFAPASLAVVGVDADHYHVPNAVNLALGVPAFGVPATPHLYPMGTSVLAAWFLLALRDLLLVDLATLLPFLLAWFAIIRLFAEVTGRNGLTWGPPVALALLATPLFQYAVPMSADLFYTAAFLALTAVLLKGCVRLHLDGVDLLSFALSAGMLVGSKSVGVFSAAMLVGVYGLIAGVRVLLTRSRFSWTGLSPTTAAMALALIVASGGLWLFRNWWLFQSPLAPTGLSILGVQIFAGTPFDSSRYYVSVFKDMRDIEGYNVMARFAHWVGVWFGAWFLPAGLSVIWLAVDIGAAARRRTALPEATRTALVFVGASLVLSAAHFLLLAGAPWSSLEHYRGFTLRYALPCFALYSLAAYCCWFSTAVPWWHSRPALLAGALLVLATGWYIAHQDISRSLIDLTPAWLTPQGVALAVVVLASWLGVGRLPSGLIRAAARPALLVLLALLAGVYVNARDREQLVAASSEFARAASSRDPANPYRDTYLAILAYERATDASCPRRRLFVATRFDAPLELQPPRFENEVLESRVTFELSLMRQMRVGAGPCDYVIASRGEIDSVRGVPLLNLVRPTGSLREAGQAGEYVIYAAKNPTARPSD
jgi:hypothetical protein